MKTTGPAASQRCAALAACILAAGMACLGEERAPGASKRISGYRVAYATYFGGSGKEFLLMPTVGPGGNIYVVGGTTSKDFPVTDNAVQ